MVSSVKQGRPAMALRGVLMIVFGAVLLLLPGLPAALALLAFGVVLLLGGLASATLALHAAGEGEDSWWLPADGVLMAAIGLATVAVPDASARAVVMLFGAWALAAALLQLIMAARLQRETRDSAGLLWSAAVSMAMGALFVLRPDLALGRIDWLLGAFALVSGALALHLAVKATGMRRRHALF